MKDIKDEEYLVNDSDIGVANYLVSLYERVKTKYQYYPSKINKLLTIYKLCTLKYNGRCLNDSYFVITDEGEMGMLSGTYWAFNNYYSLVPEDYNEIDDEIETATQCKDFLSPEVKMIKGKFGENYEKQLCISDDAKKLLEIIFRKFGNYPYHELSEQLSEITSNIPLTKRKEKNYIEMDNFYKFMDKNRRVLKNNVIYSFVRKYDKEKVDELSKLSLEKTNHVKKKNLIKVSINILKW